MMSEKTPEELLSIILPKIKKISSKRYRVKIHSEENKQKSRERILRTKPWEKATGAKTPEGKKKVGQNAFKHGKYSKTMKEIDKLVVQIRKDVEKETT